MDSMKLKNNKIDWIIESICLILLVGVTVYLIFNWGNIPDKIPAHYNWKGNIDRWGNKTELMICPIMSWFLYLLITGLQQLPLIWNTGVKITEENEERVYRTLKYLLETLKLIVVADLTYLTVNSLMGKTLSGWFTMIVLAAVFGDLIFWIVRLYQVK